MNVVAGLATLKLLSLIASSIELQYPKQDKETGLGPLMRYRERILETKIH